MAVLAWFAAQNSGWYECGKRYTAEEAKARAQEYAKVVLEETKGRPEPDVAKKVLAMIAQESAFDECNIASWAKKRFKLRHKPTKAQSIALLRKTTNSGKIDAGPLQRVYPPYGMSRYPAEKALDLRFQVKLLAQRLPMFLKTCESLYGKDRHWRLRWTVKTKGGGKKVVTEKRRLYCQDMYFTLHNTGGMSVNSKYYKSVSFQWRRWEKQLRKEDSLAMK